MEILGPDQLLQALVRYGSYYQGFHVLEYPSWQPLSPDEAHLYNKAQEQNINKIDTADDLQKYVKLTEQLTNTVNMDYKTTRIKYSGLLNPFPIGLFRP